MEESDNLNTNMKLSFVINQSAYEKCYFDLLSKKNWRKFKTLADVFEKQYEEILKTTRATQTQWRWRLMAERWKHARIINAREEPFLDRTARLMSSTEPSNWSLKGRASDSKLGSLTQRTPVSDLTSASFSANLSRMSSEPTFGISDTESSDDELTKLEQEKYNEVLKMIHDLRKTRQCDKVIDTSDLDFDPYDPFMRYTRRESLVEPLYVNSEMMKDFTRKDSGTPPNRYDSFSSSPKKDEVGLTILSTPLEGIDEGQQDSDTDSIL